MPTTIADITKAITTARERIDLAEREFPALIDLFATLPGKVFYAYFYPESAKIIMHVDTRTAFAPIRALRHGTWEKHITRDDGADAVHYRGDTDSGIEISCYVRELPPSCRFVEEVETLPAQEALPERTVTVRRLKCDAATKDKACDQEGDAGSAERALHAYNEVA